MYRKAMVTLAACFAAVAGCTPKGVEGGGPGKVLGEYVSRSFALKAIEERSALMDLTTGEVRATLEKMSPDEFRHHFIDERREFISMRIRDERSLAPDRYSITYELTYLSRSGNPPSQDKVTNKKHALFLGEGGKWRIGEVRNLKTYIEHQNEMSL